MHSLITDVVSHTKISWYNSVKSHFCVTFIVREVLKWYFLPQTAITVQTYLGLQKTDKSFNAAYLNKAMFITQAPCQIPVFV